MTQSIGSVWRGSMGICRARRVVVTRRAGSDISPVRVAAACAPGDHHHDISNGAAVSATAAPSEPIPTTRRTLMHCQDTRSARLAQMIEDRASNHGAIVVSAAHQLTHMIDMDGVPARPAAMLLQLRLVLGEIRTVLTAVEAASTSSVPDAGPAGLDLAALLQDDVSHAIADLTSAMNHLAWVVARADGRPSRTIKLGAVS